MSEFDRNSMVYNFKLPELLSKHFVKCNLGIFEAVFEAFERKFKERRGIFLAPGTTPHF